jgi:hypothetical protein
VVCPEYKDSQENSIIILPDYIWPGRKYPVFVYIYAIWLYSSNTGISQRAVAEEVRKKFGLPDFSHSTVGRIFKAFEISASRIESAPVAGGTAAGNRAVQKRRFPSVHDTAERRKRVWGFISNIVEGIQDNVIEASRIIVKYWYDKNKRLLI